MQKIRIIGMFFENRLHWQFEVGEKLQMAVVGYIFIYVQKKILLRNFLCVFYN
jgi:hypothetical protein